ncbi:MAG TPA: hypothetical protein ENJ80_12935 [Gammaproteobacteria bacterium]|nr:hypothetical protein [Gammaproteobacteria bacterium]
MERTELVKAAMAAGGPDATYGPAQLQKLFFLIDREIASLVDGPVFQFNPYDYGPFDSEVYDTVGELQVNGSAVVDHSQRFRTYSLTPQGYHEGAAILQQMSGDARHFIERAASWVRSVSFQEMVSAIYKQYPDMKANSIFKE